MHWCADETQAVINMLSTVDVVWLWLRALVARAFRSRTNAHAHACVHEHEDSWRVVLGARRHRTDGKESKSS